jgi:hypothetical protein
MKISVLAVAVGCAFGALYISNNIRVDSTLETMKSTVWRNAFDRPGQDNQFFVKMIADTRRTASHDTLIAGGLVVLGGFAGGLWTALLFRQVAAAFWLACLVPTGLVLLTGKVLGNFPDAVVQGGLFVVLGAYSVVGFLWAKRMFLEAQDTHWTGGVIEIPRWGSVSSQTSAAAHRIQKPLRALLRKELQSQHMNLLLAGGMLILHLAVLLLRSLSAEYLAAHRSVAMTLEEFPRLWLLLPLLISSVAVAEERKLATLESSLCLPAKRLTLFLMKLSVALTLGMLFGAVIPLGVEHYANLAGVRGNPGGLYFLGETRPIWLVQIAGAAGLTGLALYGSTLTRNTLQALGAGLVASLLACFIMFLTFVAGHAAGSQGIILWSGPLIEFIGWPVMITTLLVLAHRNLGRLHPDGHTWLRNGLIVFISLACTAVTTTIVYHRAWEAWLPEEPPHAWGPSIYPVRQNRAEIPARLPMIPKVRASSFRKAALLPDGRLWLSQRQARLQQRQVDNPSWMLSFATGPLRTGFVAGSNWRDIAVTDLGCFAIQTDGSLWDLSELQVNDSNPTRVGHSRVWSKISAGGQHYCAIKSDGTLWEWGLESHPAGSRSLSGKSLSIPRQVGSDNDWVAVCSSWQTSAAMKSDGSIWRWREVWQVSTNGRRTYSRAQQPIPWLAAPCNQPRSIAMSDQAIAAVCEDGSLWLGGDLTNTVYARLLGEGQAGMATREMVRWGDDVDWKEIVFTGWGKVVGVKRDGSLRQWSLVWFGPWNGWVIPAIMPSRYMDWVCAGSDGNAYLALARDGSLCLWGDPEEGRYSDDWNGPDQRRLLMPSRIKARRIADLSR